jgi:hypothetical protein
MVSIWILGLCLLCIKPIAADVLHLLRLIIKKQDTFQIYDIRVTIYFSGLLLRKTSRSYRNLSKEIMFRYGNGFNGISRGRFFKREGKYQNL